MPFISSCARIQRVTMNATAVSRSTRIDASNFITSRQPRRAPTFAHPCRRTRAPTRAHARAPTRTLSTVHIARRCRARARSPPWRCARRTLTPPAVALGASFTRALRASDIDARHRNATRAHRTRPAWVLPRTRRARRRARDRDARCVRAHARFKSTRWVEHSRRIEQETVRSMRRHGRGEVFHV